MFSLAASTLLSGRYAMADVQQDATGNGPEVRVTEAEQMNSTSRSRTQQYGYHNTFHLHASPILVPTTRPPTYQTAVRCESPLIDDAPLPRYNCTVFLEGQLGVKCELASPFMLAPPHASHWQDVYMSLQGTQLRVYKLKKAGRAGKLLKTYSMQHAEVGVAADVKKSDPIPKSPLCKWMPLSTRQKVFETDPHLFEPLREHIIRVRVETEQFLLCAASQTEMLDWVETMAAAIDIAMPLDVRGEPRYRSLPRRARRQREIEGRRSAELSNIEEQPSLVRQQEQIIRELYPHLAADHDHQRDREVAAAREVERLPQQQPAAQAGTADEVDAEADDYDRSDALLPTTSVIEATPAPTANTPLTEPASAESYFDFAPPRRNSLEAVIDEDRLAPSPSPGLSSSDALSAEMSEARTTEDTPESDSDVKSTRRATPQLTPASALRYRRRCAPVLLASSPRASDIIVQPITAFGAGQHSPAMRRVKIDFRRQKLLPFEQSAPKYDAHDFDSISETAPLARPTLERGDTGTTVMSSESASDTVDEEIEHSELNVVSAASAGTEADTNPTTESSDSISQAPALPVGLDGASTEDITPMAAAKMTEMSREVSKSSVLDGTVPPSPTSSADGVLLSKMGSNDAADLSQALAKRTRRLSLSSKLLGRDRRASRPHVKPVIPASMATEAQMAAYAALMF